MNKRRLLFLLGLALLLTGCFAAPKTTTNGVPWQDAWIRVGVNIGVDAPKQLTLLDNKDALAADGLYYATWVDGKCVSHTKKDGDTVNLYDAQLYFLVSESPEAQGAVDNYTQWLTSARDTYDVTSEYTCTINGQIYTLLKYQCVGDDNPYSHGISAFTSCGVTAVCAEFICLEDYTEDLETLFTDFLNGCHFRAD